MLRNEQVFARTITERRSLHTERTRVTPQRLTKGDFVFQGIFGNVWK